MNLLDPVSTIMTPHPVTLSPEDPLMKVKSVFDKYSIHHIPILDEGDLVGIVSKSDFLFFKRGFNSNEVYDKVEEVRLHQYKVKEIMTTKLAKLHKEDKVMVALDLFKENIFHALPVIEGNKLVGIVTTYDVIKHLLQDKEAHASY